MDVWDSVEEEKGKECNAGGDIDLEWRKCIQTCLLLIIWSPGVYVYVYRGGRGGNYRDNLIGARHVRGMSGAIVVRQDKRRMKRVRRHDLVRLEEEEGSGECRQT